MEQFILPFSQFLLQFTGPRQALSHFFVFVWTQAKKYLLHTCRCIRACIQHAIQDAILSCFHKLHTASTYAHLCTPVHTYVTYTILRTLTHTFTNLRAPTQTYAHLHAPTQTYAHLRTLTHTYAHLHKPTHTYAHLRKRSCIFLAHFPSDKAWTPVSTAAACKVFSEVYKRSTSKCVRVRVRVCVYLCVCVHVRVFVCV
jgi:hypothetical protein